MKIAAFAWNHEGLGHVSRLIAINQLIASKRSESIFFVQHEQELINSYGLSQVILPSYKGAFLGEDWWDGKNLGIEKSKAEDMSELLIDAALSEEKGIILHDVVIHKDLYKFGIKNGWPQYYFYRNRKDVIDPFEWLSVTAPAIKKFFWVDKIGYKEYRNEIMGIGLPIIERRLLLNHPIWDSKDSGIRIAISPGGGGYEETKDFLEKTVKGVIEFSGKNHIRVSLKIITGPFYKDNLRFPSFDRNISVELFRFLPPTKSLYEGTELLICQGGFNSLAEAQSNATPVIVVPRKRQLDDQFERASKFHSEGYHSVCLNVNNLKYELSNYMEFRKGNINISRENSRDNQCQQRLLAKKILENEMIPL